MPMAERLKCPCGRTHSGPTPPRQALHTPAALAPERTRARDQVYAQWIQLNARRVVTLDELAFRQERAGLTLDIGDHWYAD